MHTVTGELLVTVGDPTLSPNAVPISEELTALHEGDAPDVVDAAAPVVDPEAPAAVEVVAPDETEDDDPPHAAAIRETTAHTVIADKTREIVRAMD